MFDDNGLVTVIIPESMVIVMALEALAKDSPVTYVACTQVSSVYSYK